MSKPFTHRYILRAVIEFTTPFLVGAGRNGDIADAVFVADANGLPAIPGSSLAGVLRATFTTTHGEAAANELFGFQRGNQGAGSRLAVSWACIHDAKNCPVEGIVPLARLDDPVLAKAMSPIIRDHVRITHRGASDAKGRGKFDEQAVCAGHRFTFELELVGTEAEQGLWDKLLTVLTDPALRLGGKTRRGFGAFKFVEKRARAFDLCRDFDSYRQHPISLAESSPVLELFPIDGNSTIAKSRAQVVRLQLKPQGYWMFGGGYDLPDVAGEADMAPVRDCRIEWSEKNIGVVRDDLLVIPATGIKGALTHRVAFHYNALTGVFADALGEQRSEDVTGENNPAVRELFGYCKGKDKREGDSDDDDRSVAPKKKDREEGQRGRVILDDLYLDADPNSQIVHHVGIDRFTGGARDKVLFCERPLWQGALIDCELRITETNAITNPNVMKALRLAVEDLAEGRLQIGAGSGRGLGYFKGQVIWPEVLNA